MAIYDHKAVIYPLAICVYYQVTGVSPL